MSFRDTVAGARRKCGAGPGGQSGVGRHRRAGAGGRESARDLGRGAGRCDRRGPRTLFARRSRAAPPSLSPLRQRHRTASSAAAPDEIPGCNAPRPWDEAAGPNAAGYNARGIKLRAPH